MNRTQLLLIYLYLLPLHLLLLVACAGGPAPDPAAAPDANIERQLRQKRQKDRETLAKQENIYRVLLDLDKIMDKYFSSMLASGNKRATVLLTSLDKIIREKTNRHFPALVARADNPDYPGNRSIALTAIGFASKANSLAALNPLLTALTDENPLVVGKALLGLGVLRLAQTPPGHLGRIMEDDRQPLGVRTNASWALLELQPHLPKDKAREIAPYWQRLLSQPIGELEDALVVHAVKGLGLFREERFAETVEPYISHPTALVRIHAAIALGRMGQQSSHTSLLALLSPAETNMNVRLAARKALQALAGGRDRRYDVKSWKQLFERTK